MDLLDCSGKWYLDNNGEWSMEHDSVVTTCDHDNNNTNISNPYGNNVCIYNDGSLWDSGIVTFKFLGYQDGYPYFHYHYVSGNKTINYYLHYVYNEMFELNKWVISKNKASSIVGAYCEQEDLKHCLYGTWNVEMTDGDSSYYDIDDSMGYDTNCGNNDHDNNDNNNGESTKYCDQQISCAKWLAELELGDDNQINSLCDDSFVLCLTESLENDVSSVKSSHDCIEGESRIILNFNVSFNDISGKATYNSFRSQYETIAKTCAQNNNSDVTGIDGQFISSNITLCNNCQSFLNENESGAQTQMVVYNTAFIIALVVVLLYF